MQLQIVFHFDVVLVVFVMLQVCYSLFTFISLRFFAVIRNKK